MPSMFAFGLAVQDFVFQLDELPQGGLKFPATEFRTDGGGMSASAAVAFSRLGGAAKLGARLGGDRIADQVLADLGAAGVDVTAVHRTTGGRSPCSVVALDRQGERQIVMFRGEGLVEDTEWLDCLPDCDVVLTDTSWEPGLRKTLRLAGQRGLPRVVDVERAVPVDSLAMATHLAFSRQGLQDLTGEPDAIEGLRLVAERLSNWICVTDGAEGVLRIGNSSIERIPAFPVAARDTLGAGDVWHGAFCLRLAEGADEDTCVSFANAAAAIKCTRRGGRLGYPNRRDVDRLLDAAD